MLEEFCTPPNNGFKNEKMDAYSDEQSHGLSIGLLSKYIVKSKRCCVVLQLRRTIGQKIVVGQKLPRTTHPCRSTPLELQSRFGGKANKV